jgi:dTDP-4-dehydrorhamnose reductase
MSDFPKILITGANGQIGRALSKNLTTQGLDYLGLDKAQLDICDYKKVKEVLADADFDVLVNCAAFTNTEEAEVFPENAFKVNETGIEHLVEVCNTLDKPIIHISTNCIFDGLKASPYLETDLPQPQSIYGKSKYAGEQIISAYSKQFCILRTSWVFSQYEGHNFVLKILDIAREQGFLKVVNDQFGRPTCAFQVADIINLLVLRMVSHDLEKEIYHFGSHPSTNWFEFTVKIFEIAQAIGLSNPLDIDPVATGVVPTKVNRPKNGILNCDKIQKDLNINLPHWQDDLEKMLHSIAFKEKS